MLEEFTLTSKGQTTIPTGIRDSLRLKSVDRITITLMHDGTVLMRVKNGARALPIKQLSR